MPRSRWSLSFRSKPVIRRCSLGLDKLTRCQAQNLTDHTRSAPAPHPRPAPAWGEFYGTAGGMTTIERSWSPSEGAPPCFPRFQRYAVDFFFFEWQQRNSFNRSLSAALGIPRPKNRGKPCGGLGGLARNKAEATAHDFPRGRITRKRACWRDP